MKKRLIILLSVILLVLAALPVIAQEATVVSARDVSISTTAEVRSTPGCLDYCEDGVFYYRGDYNTRTGCCDYAYRYECAYGCNSREDACKAEAKSTTESVEMECPDYCRDGVHYSRGIYNDRLDECEYSYRKTCEYSCNNRGNACASVEERDCPDYCKDGIHYYRGTYNERARSCKYTYRSSCEYGCDRAGEKCISASQTEMVKQVASGDYCTDSDDGIDFEEAGRVGWKNAFDSSEGILYDHCVGNEIIEYYCQDDGVRNVAYMDCFEEDMVCKDAVCVEMEFGECVDPDGDDVTTKEWADGTNVWNEGTVSWGDYCSEDPDGGSADSGPYVHEAICLEVDDGYYEVRYASPQRCRDGCVDGVCVGSGEVEESAPKGVCTDYDGGRVIKEASYVHGDSGRMVGDFYDFCSDHDAGIGYVDKGDYVHEYFCEDGFVVGQTIECDELCYLGQCVISEELTAAEDSAGQTETLRAVDENRRRGISEELQESREVIDEELVAARRTRIDDELYLSTRQGVTVEVRNRTLVIEKANREYEVEEQFDELLSRHSRVDDIVEKVEIEVEEERPVYTITSRRRARLLGFIPASIEVSTSVDAENLEFVRERLSWWSFLAVTEE